MNTVAVYNYNTPVQPLRDITTELFHDFVTWVGRSEKTAITYLKNLKQFMAWLKYSVINRPSREDIILYRQWLMNEHEAITLNNNIECGWSFRTDGNGNKIKVNCKPNTVKQYLQSVRQFFSWTAAEGIYPNIAENIHAPKIRNDIHKKDSLTASQVLKIENSIAQKAEERTKAAANELKDTAGKIQRSTEQGKRLFAMYLLAVNAGLRTIEISRADIKDLETKDGKTYLYVWGKGHNEPDQKKPIAPEVKKAIDDYLKCRSDYYTNTSPLFVGTGNRNGGKRMTPTTISTLLKRAMQAAGFDSERLTAHSLRHTTGQNIMELTSNNIYMTQMYMRHTSPKTTEIYLNNDSTEQDERLARKLYLKYHEAEEEAETAEQISKLSAITQGMTPEQLQKLATIAAAII